MFPFEFSTGASRESGKGPAGEFTAGNDIVTTTSDELVPGKDDGAGQGMDHVTPGCQQNGREAVWIPCRYNL